MKLDFSKVENEIARIIYDVAFDLHRTIGPGLLESAYENALADELAEKGLHVRQQQPIPFIYKDVKLEVGYRVDILIEQKVLIEVKSVETLAPVHFAQTLTYLRLASLKLGILINFNTALLKHGIHRVVNGL